MTTQRCGTCKYVKWQLSPKGHPMRSQYVTCTYKVIWPTMPSSFCNTFENGDTFFIPAARAMWPDAGTHCPCYEPNHK